MTSRTLIAVLALLLLTLLGGLSCKRTPSVPQRPVNVPQSAIWAGGRDGGAFIDCTPSTHTNYLCSVFNDVTGDVWMSGKFVVEGRASSGLVQPSEYSGFDGQRILLYSGSMVPTDASRPPGVPDRAVLAENGIWVHCDHRANADYDCSLFLASTGRKIAGGAYKLQGAEETTVAGMKPKIANRSEIFLVGGAVLRARN